MTAAKGTETVKSAGSANILVLVPTQLELAELQRVASWLTGHRPSASSQSSDSTLSGNFSATGRMTVELCGFGPIAAAATTSRWLANNDYDAVMLVGIAGTYGEIAVGDACTFTSVAIDDLGAQSSQGLLLPSRLGLPQWSPGQDSQDRVAGSHPGTTGEPHDAKVSQGDDPIFERLPLTSLASEQSKNELLTVCAASGDSQQAIARQQRFPFAVAEDMEAFGVALACHLADRPLFVVRGISNRAGDRTIADWKISDALASAAGILRGLLESERLVDSFDSKTGQSKPDH